MTNVAGDDCRPKSSSRTLASTAGWWIQPPSSSAFSRLRCRQTSTEVSSVNWSLTGTFGCRKRCDASQKPHKSRNATRTSCQFTNDTFDPKTRQVETFQVLPMIQICRFVLPTDVHQKSATMPSFRVIISPQADMAPELQDLGI